MFCLVMYCQYIHKPHSFTIVSSIALISSDNVAFLSALSACHTLMLLPALPINILYGESPRLGPHGGIMALIEAI